MGIVSSVTSGTERFTIGGDPSNFTAPTTKTIGSSFPGPKQIAQELSAKGGRQVVVVHSDLRQFYDRVRPRLLAKKMENLVRAANDAARFYRLANRVFNWRWHEDDESEVEAYRKQAKIRSFSSVALPQGLVASGFFANVCLLDFDRACADAVSDEICDGVRMNDFCRYVDDLRIVVTAERGKDLDEIGRSVADWIQVVLDSQAKGLEVSSEKTVAAEWGGASRPLVRQSQKMERIQGAISGGFDAIGGAEILDSIQGLIRSQQRFSEGRATNKHWPFLAVPDVADDTVARFAAGRFRSTFRSLRPLLPDHEEPSLSHGDEEDAEIPTDRAARLRTRSELDNEARAFSFGPCRELGRRSIQHTVAENRLGHLAGQRCT